MQLPAYDQWNENSFLVHWVWVLFLIFLFIMNVTMLNFLIAIVSETYESVIENSSFFTYKFKLDIMFDVTFPGRQYVINKLQTIGNYLFKMKMKEDRELNSFNNILLVGTTRLEDQSDSNANVYHSFVKTLKHHMNSLETRINQKIDKHTKKMAEEMHEMSTEVHANN